MTQPEIFEYLKNLLTQQLQHFSDMTLLLDQELDAVKTRSGEKLTNVAKQKEILLQQIRDLDQQIGKENYLKFIDEQTELKTLRQTISDKLIACQQQNEVVYLAATQTATAVEDVKRLLIGGSKNTTYDAYGQKQSAGRLGKGIKA